jgi:hypothetical protein
VQQIFQNGCLRPIRASKRGLFAAAITMPLSVITYRWGLRNTNARAGFLGLPDRHRGRSRDGHAAQAVQLVQDAWPAKPARACHPVWHLAAGDLGERLIIGGADEATDHVRDCGPVWHQTPGAVAWLNRIVLPCQKSRRLPPKPQSSGRGLRATPCRNARL